MVRVEETKDPNYQTELDKARGGKLMLKLEHGGSVVSEQEIIGSFPGVEEMLGPVYTLADIQAVNVDEGSSTKLLFYFSIYMLLFSAKSQRAWNAAFPLAILLMNTCAYAFKSSLALHMW